MSTTQTHLAIHIRFLYGGGAERVLVNLMPAFIQQGVKVDLVMNMAEGPYLLEVPPEVRIIDLKTKKTLAGLPKLVRYLRQERPKVLLSFLHYPNEIAILAKLLAFVNTRVIVSERNALSMHAGNEPSSEKWSTISTKLLYPLADGILANSNGVAQDLANITGISPKRIKVIYNPTITPDIFEKSQQTLDHPWFQLGQPPVVLGVGRLDPQKNFSTLIKAFAKVRQTKPCRLMILGKGREKVQLQALIKELDIENDVALPGFADNPYPYLKKAAVFVLSSLWEGLPNVLIEALALGTPVISTNCLCGPEEILDGGKYGSLVPVGDYEAIAKEILDILSGNSRQVDSAWLEQFKVENVAQQYLEFLGLT
ncbi:MULTISPECIES: glycosyltransferase [unclassified Okeania]|uniref:glycosyltransferase n=1 Tax=unclassified Okeania TaxID=2634635 RepID=UPI0013C1ECC6|nr:MULTISPECIES: glycosyltransferase [unclassified Okeania]NEN90427.1 glycosyltransferase [Okeania sp. SIO3H1]NET29676.1 glycosyltransferase [Okeania sp. SIO1I7]NET43125.1 glycosyltransferase [Okeania sp. SIO2B3]